MTYYFTTSGERTLSSSRTIGSAETFPCGWKW